MTSPPNHMGDDSSLQPGDGLPHPALLPCPFCGDTKTLKPGASYHAVRIYCRCGATGPSIFASYDEDVEDIDPAACVAAWGTWNRRAPQDEAGAEGSPGATNNPTDRITALEEALREIRDHWACQYDHPRKQGDAFKGPYGTGVTDGHRAAANIARRALGAEGEGK